MSTTATAIRCNKNNSHSLQERQQPNVATTAPPRIMSSSYVWVQLYYKGEETNDRDPVESIPIPRNIAAVKGAVLPELGPALLGEVKVYAPDTERPFSEQTSIRGDKILKELIDELGNKILKLSFDMIIP
jgi:hypothetical protein